MAIPSKQIGWSQESNLLWEICKRMEKLTGVVFTSGGGGGCGDCPVTTDGVTITGNGTVANPLIANIPTIPTVTEGTFTPNFTNTNNCAPVATGDFYYTQLNNTLFIWGSFDNNGDDANPWSCDIDNLPLITNNFANTFDVIGLSEYKQNPMLIKAVVGTTKLTIVGGGSSITADGVYTFSCIAKIL